MTMKMSFRWFGEDADPVKLQQIRQLPGVDQIVGTLFDQPAGAAWPEAEIAALKHQVAAAGMKLEVIESVNIHEDIKLGRPSRDQYIENYITTIKRLAKYGIKVICYNFMPIFDWTRTDLFYQLPDGSTDLAFDHTQVQGSAQAMIAKAKAAHDEYPMPGWEPERLDDLATLFTAYEGVTEADLAENLRYFLAAIIPTCEAVGIKMAIHPDDPPQPLFGLPRIVKNRDDLDRIIHMVDSPMNGLTLCVGSLGEDPANDVPAIIREFVGLDRVPFVHARNLKRGENGDFHETAHASSAGSIDMYEIINTLTESGFDGYIRPDHGRMIWGETGRAGYGLYDRALGSQYLNGLIEACAKAAK